MKKNEYIEKYGEEAFEKRRIQTKELLEGEITLLTERTIRGREIAV